MSGFTRNRTLILCLVLTALSALSALTACSEDNTSAAENLGTQGFEIPGPACAVGDPQSVNVLGNANGSRFAQTVATLPNGGVVAAGFADLPTGARNGWVSALDGFGEPMWEKLFPTAFTADMLTFDGEHILLVGSDQDTNKQRLIKLDIANGQTLFERTFDGNMGSTRALWRQADGGYLLAISQNDGGLLLHNLSRGGETQETTRVELGAFGSAKLINDSAGGQIIVPTFDMFAPREIQGSLSTAIQHISADGSVLATHDFSDAAFATNHASDATLTTSGDLLVSIERAASDQWLSSEVHVQLLDPTTLTPNWQAILPLKSALRSTRVHIPPGSDYAFVTGTTYADPTVFAPTMVAWRVALADGTAEEILVLPMPQHAVMSAYPRGAQATTQGLHLVWDDSTPDARWQMKVNNISPEGELSPTLTLFESTLAGTQECTSLTPYRSADGHRLLMTANCVNPELGGYVQIWRQQASCPL